MGGQDENAGNGQQHRSPGNDASQSSAAQPPKHPVTCLVTMLDGNIIDFVVDRSATGKELFDKVTKYLNLKESDYFALRYKDNLNSNNWLYGDKRIKKQLPDPAPYHLQFSVKFYPPDPLESTAISEDLTRYLLYLQVRDDVNSGRLPCSMATQALLGSYVAQAEFSDFQPRDHAADGSYLVGANCVPTKMETQQMLSKVNELHRIQKGKTAGDAETHYLENAAKLSLYGVDLHKAKDANSVHIQLGVCAHGLMLFRDQIRVNRYAWPKIIKIAYRRNDFSVELRPGEVVEKSEAKIRFKMPNYRAAKRLYKSCVEHHTFFRLTRTEDKPKKGLFRFGSQRFRYAGRTQFQTKLTSSLDERPPPNVQRSQSARLASRSQEETPIQREHLSFQQNAAATPLHYADDGTTQPKSTSPSAKSPEFDESPVQKANYQFKHEYHRITAPTGDTGREPTDEQVLTAKKQRRRPKPRGGSSTSSSSSSAAAHAASSLERQTVAVLTSTPMQTLALTPSPEDDDPRRVVSVEHVTQTVTTTTAAATPLSAKDQKKQKKEEEKLRKQKEKEDKERQKREERERKKKDKDAKKNKSTDSATVVSERAKDGGGKPRRTRSGSSSSTSSSASSADGRSKKPKGRKGKRISAEAPNDVGIAPSDVLLHTEGGLRDKDDDGQVIVRQWEESAEGPVVVTEETDEFGNIITKTSQVHTVKQTIQKQTFHTVEVPESGDLPTTLVQTKRHVYSPAESGDQSSPAAVRLLQGSEQLPIVQTESRTVSYHAAPSALDAMVISSPQMDSPAEFVSSRIVDSGNKTVETITYKTEQPDGTVETHVEYKVTVHGGNDIDHDAELNQAIMEATQMNPNMTVEKIEVKQETQC